MGRVIYHLLYDVGDYEFPHITIEYPIEFEAIWEEHIATDIIFT